MWQSICPHARNSSINAKHILTNIFCGAVRKCVLEDLSVDGRIILKRFFKKQAEGMNWIDLAQLTDRWRANVNAEMNRQVP